MPATVLTLLATTASWYEYDAVHEGQYPGTMRGSNSDQFTTSIRKGSTVHRAVVPPANQTVQPVVLSVWTSIHEVVSINSTIIIVTPAS